MITGFNTDIDHDGRVYHVQTEDKGLNNPVVESLVYCGGEIIEARRSSYREILDSGSYTEDDIRGFMESQHQTVIGDIKGGRLQEVELKPFGHSIVTNRSLDEVVLCFLGEVPVDRVKLNMTGPKVLREGARPKLRLKVLESNTDRPICGAQAEVRLVVKGAKPVVLFKAATDETGEVQASFEIPELAGSTASIVCRAKVSGKAAEVKRPVRKRRVAPAVKKVRAES